MTDVMLTVVEKRVGQPDRRYQYREAENGDGVMMTESRQDYALDRWRHVGSERIDDLDIELTPAVESRTGF